MPRLYYLKRRLAVPSISSLRALKHKTNISTNCFYLSRRVTARLAIKR